MKPLFSADSIGKSFGRHTVLRVASVWAHSGRITALFGRNGCGKSTLLKIGAGLLRADHGAVHYANDVYLRPRLPVLARAGLFYLPTRGLLSPRLTLREHLHSVKNCVGGADAQPILDRLCLGALLDRRIREYSGGERRRAEIAMAALRAPRCLLADEPFIGITPVDAVVFASIFRDMAAGGCALVITGHEVPQLMELADDVVWMTAGTTHHIGDPAQAAAHEQFRREYLGPARWTRAAR